MSGEAPPDRECLRDLLEPGALHPGFPPAEREVAWDSEIGASQAISLKRIADALTSNGADDLITTLHGPLTNLAWEMGRSFQGGTRTDR